MQLTKIHWKLKKSQSKPIGNRNVKGRILRTGFTRGHKIRSKTEFKLISALFWELRATAGDVRYCTSMSLVQRVGALPTGLSPGSLLGVSNIFFLNVFQTKVSMYRVLTDRKKAPQCWVCRSFTSSSKCSCSAS